jgi:hypothetical protein
VSVPEPSYWELAPTQVFDEPVSTMRLKDWPPTVTGARYESTALVTLQ